MKPKISENIKAFRLQKKLTQKELAVSLSVSPQAVSRWEQGQAYPDVFMLEKLASFFGVTMDALVGRGEEYVTGLINQWNEMRFHIQNARDALEECELLEKLALVGQMRIPYWRALLYYKQRSDRTKGSNAEEASLEKRIDSARAMVKEHLKNVDIETRLRDMEMIFFVEEEEKLEQWKEFLPTEFAFINFSDFMLERYRHAVHDPKNYNIEMQQNTYKRISALLYSLAASYCPDLENKKSRIINSRLHCELHTAVYYKAALDTIDVYSTKEWDVFLPQRTLALMRYAAALLKEGNEAQGIAVLDTIKDMMPRMEKCYLKGEKIKGSVPVLVDVEEKYPMYFLARMLDDVASESSLPEFAPYREQMKDLEAVRLEIVKRLHDLSLEQENQIKFNVLIQKALDTLSAQKDAKMILVMEYDDGTLHTSAYDPYAKEASHEEQSKTILEKDRPIVKRMIALWQQGGVEIPSYAFRKLLLEMHPENANTIMLTQGQYKYQVRTLVSTMPPQ